MTGRVPRHKRNPRRAYDADGSEIVPPTVGSCRAQDETTALAICEACDHEAIVSTDGLPADLPFPDIALRLVCGSCGSRRITVRKDMAAYYARLEATTGWRSGAAGAAPTVAPEPTAGIGFPRPKR